MKRFCILYLCSMLMLLCIAPVASAKTNSSVPPVVVNWLGVLPKLPETPKDWVVDYSERAYKSNEEITFALQLLVLPTGFENVELRVWSDQLNMRQSKPMLVQMDDKKLKRIPLTGLSRTNNGFTLQLDGKSSTFAPANVYNIVFTARNACDNDGVVHAMVSDGRPASMDQGDAIIMLSDKYLRMHKQAITEPVSGLEGTQVASYTLSYMDGVEIIRIIVGEDAEILGFAKLIGNKVLTVRYNLARKRYVTSDGREVIHAKELQGIFKSLSISFLKPFSDDALLAMAGYERQDDFSFHAIHTDKNVAAP